MNRKNVYSVGQINSYIKNMFTQDYMLRSIYVKGEVSNVKYHSSGHIYFTMKDKSSTLSCVMFAGNRGGLKFTMTEGQQIICGGGIDIYERDGKYQLYARDIVLDGVGQLYERYEQLKRQLEEMGMFAPEYKKPIPKYASRVGIVTARTGAAIRDIINISRRRNPYVQLILYPAKVQGDGADESVVSGIRALDGMGLDVIIVGRGGGSIEDLWAFNEEIVARAIFECETPVISAVGHETDTTIADHVADMRAPTPSAAAELAVFSLVDLEERISIKRSALLGLMSAKIKDSFEKKEKLALRLSLLSPKSVLNSRKMQYTQYLERIEALMSERLLKEKHRLDMVIGQMKALSPLDKMSSGYSYVSADDGRRIKSAADVTRGQVLMISLKDGRIRSRVEEVISENLSGED